ncbi:hypothetical protein [Microbacterium sp. gxy059]|uniref:hypothetical protein n=1 Tax=Microbacterium sp. gxy059 TaxID=2957199 RepID=UPI003D96C62C
MDRWPWHLTSAKAWPATATTLKTGIVRLLTDAADRGVRISGNLARSVHVASSPFTRRGDVDRVTVDISGSRIQLDGDRLARADRLVPTPRYDEIVERVPGSIGQLRLAASPVTIEGHEVRAELSVRDLPLDWLIMRRDGELVGTAGEHRGDGRANGSFRVETTQEALVALAEHIVSGAFRHVRGAKLESIAATISPHGADRLTVAGGAAFKAFFLRFSVRIGADVTIARDGTATVHRATAASRRILSKLALLPLRGRLRALAGRSFPLGGDAFALSDVVVDASGGRLVVTGDLSSR